MTEPGHVSLWHPWQDKPGSHHTLAIWQKGDYNVDSDMDSFVHALATGKRYLFCNDLFDTQEFPFADALLRHQRTKAFISKTGSLTALKLSYKRRNSYFIPSVIWGYEREPDEEFIANVSHIFTTFGYEALSPASLSEKVLRSTLPDRLFLSRPSDMLRRVLIENSIGGRIDQKAIAEFYPVIYEYDLNKAYLYFSRSVPSPFKAPTRFWYGEKGTQDARLFDFAASFVCVSLTAHLSSYPFDLHPIQIGEGGEGARNPVEGEYIERRWLWDVELRDCLEAGYTLEHVYEGYGWHEKSQFMEEWSDILCEKDSFIENEHQKKIAKTMKVGLPGRFLKRPEVYSLVHKSERKKGEKLQPVLIHWTKETKQFIADWFIRTEYDLQSAQLTPIGSYIVAQCRQALYRRQLAEVQAGNQVISTYIDAIRLEQPSTLPNIGYDIGWWKPKLIQDAWAVGNRIIPKQFEDMLAPGVTGQERTELHAAYFNA